MTEQEQTDFSVTDRRASRMADQASDTANQSENALENNTASAPSNDDASNAIEQATSETASENTLPDPAQIVVMAGMHLSTPELIQALLAVFDAHAWRDMGFISHHDGQLEVNLPSAQLAIDCQTFLIGKVEHSLPMEDKMELQRRLNDLRVNYLEKVRAS